MHHSKPMDSLVEKGLILNLGQCPKTDKEKEMMNNISYASAVGSLVYAMLCTWSDICFAVTKLTSRLAHWQAVKRIFRYLCSLSNLILCYHDGRIF